MHRVSGAGTRGQVPPLRAPALAFGCHTCAAAELWRFDSFLPRMLWLSWRGVTGVYSLDGMIEGCRMNPTIGMFRASVTIMAMFAICGSGDRGAHTALSGMGRDPATAALQQESSCWKAVPDDQ